VNGKRRGFTLVEVVMVMGVICLGLLLAARMYPLAFRAKERMEEDSVAAFLAQQKMEELRAGGYWGLSRDIPGSEGHGKRFAVCSGNRRFRYCAEWWDTDVAGLRKVRVHVFGQESEEGTPASSTSSSSMELVTFLARRERTPE
jgi:prepilin-type N-terminal cleavage/methylation domain-containing protein